MESRTLTLSLRRILVSCACISRNCPPISWNAEHGFQHKAPPWILGGIDLDPAGDCALRYAMPWKQDGKVIGYLELGIEIAHLTRQLSVEINLDLLAVIRKECITRNKFEAGRRMFGIVYKNVPLFYALS